MKNLIEIKMDKNNRGFIPPNWVQDAQNTHGSIGKLFPEGNNLKTLSITFDKEAQDSLPQHIKDKMQADRYATQEKNKERILKIEEILTKYRRQEDFSNYGLAAYIAKNI